MAIRNVNGVLVLYHHHLMRNAPTIAEHANSFRRNSRFKVWNLNTELGFPKRLPELRFQAIALHYSIFGKPPYQLDEDFLKYLDDCEESYKIAFFQDEYHHCGTRFDFLNRYKINQVYTLLEPRYFKDVYGKYTAVPKLDFNLVGYVSEGLVELARKKSKPDEKRRIDIGYRGRELPFHMGGGAREKGEIGRRFEELSRGTGLKMDISTLEKDRIYGPAWYGFVADCRGMLGVEAGVSIFDLEDEARLGCERLLAANPGTTFEEAHKKVLYKWEGNIPYRTISPRHFEAAALRVCQILFEGKYSGVMRPGIHYIPLKKDFSNFDEVVRLFKDESVRRELTENAYRDMIASGEYSYGRFIEGFDNRLLEAGLKPEMTPEDIERVDKIMNEGKILRQLTTRARTVKYYDFPGKNFLIKVNSFRKRYLINTHGK